MCSVQIKQSISIQPITVVCNGQTLYSDTPSSALLTPYYVLWTVKVDYQTWYMHHFW